ncbi:MAG: LacI family DNA-binding transcriptional regulator [Bacillota bacterium]
MVTIKDVSKASGFSVTTVSKALNDYPDISAHTKAKIIELCDKMGYVPNSSARSLKTTHSFTIGIVFEEITNQGLQHPVFSRVLESFKRDVETEGFDILFLARQMGKQNGSYLQHSIRKQVEAILVLCADFNTPEMRELYQSDLPIVMIDFDVEGATNVTSNNKHGVFQAIEHLVDLGHTKIAHIHGDINSFIGGQRKEYFEMALETHGLAVRDDYFADGQYFSKEEGYEAMKKLIALKDPPTAIFCASDLLAIGAMEAIHEAGKKVPEDFSIVGFDGIDLGQLITPRLTTIKQDTRKIGHLAAKSMLEFIHGKKDPKQSKIITVDTELLKGDSTKPL